MSLLRCTILNQGLRRIAAAATVLLAFSHPAFSQAREPGRTIIGDWKFTAALDSTDISMRDENDAQQLVGRVMRIREDGTRFNNYQCSAPTFEARRVEPDLYLEKEGRLDNSKLRLPQPVTVVDISCAIVFLRNRNHVVITWDGWFFDATRITR